MRIILEIKDKPNENDLIIFKNKEWVLISKESLLNPLVLENIALKKELEEYKESVSLKIKAIDNKLKEYHDILQVLTKEEE